MNIYNSSNLHFIDTLKKLNKIHKYVVILYKRLCKFLKIKDDISHTTKIKIGINKLFFFFTLCFEIFFQQYSLLFLSKNF